MLQFFRQAIMPMNSLLSRLRNWQALRTKLTERPRKRLMKMQELFYECCNP